MALNNTKCRVIINADDFGITEGVNKAIFRLVDAGILTSTSVMTNMPHYKEVINVKNKIGIGIHFNLTVGKPVTESYKVPTLVNENGEFFDLQALIKKIKQRRINRQEVEIELNAQIKRLIDVEIKPDHINSHESILKYPFFRCITKRAAQTYGIKAVRTYSQRRFDYNRLLSPRKIIVSLYLNFQKLQWKWEGLSTADKHDSLINLGLNCELALNKLKDIFYDLPRGVLEMVTHPGYCDKNNEPLGEYVHEREVELEALLSKEFIQVIRNSGAELISFKDI